MKCEHKDCLTCPYDDCIYEQSKEKGKAPKRTHERSEYWAKYYEKHKERIKARMRKRYHDNKEKYSAYKKAKYQRDKFKGGGIDDMGVTFNNFLGNSSSFRV